MVRDVAGTAMAGTPGKMHLDVIPGECAQHIIRIRPGHLAGIAIARADGITLHAPQGQVGILKNLCLDYRGDLGGGGIRVRTTQGIETWLCGCACSRR